jgi:hypothetical protein
MAAPTVTETISHTAQRRTLVFVVLLLLSTLLVFAAVRPLTVSGQGGLPPLPTDANDAVLLFPNAQDSNTVDEAGPSQRYLFLARRGDSIRIVMRRTNGDLNPALELTDVNGEVLETRRADLSGRNSVLPFTIPADGWYYVEAGREDGTEGDTNGEFTLLLEGASPALYELLPAGVPPTIEGRIVLHEAQIEQSEATVEDSYLLPLVTGQTLTVAVSGVESASVQIITSSGDVLAEGTESAFYTARSSQWVVVVVGQSSPSAYTVLFAGENGVEVAFAPSYLQDLVTATPLPTATITPSSTGYMSRLRPVAVICGRDGARHRQRAEQSPPQWSKPQQPRDHTHSTGRRISGARRTNLHTGNGMVAGKLAKHRRVDSRRCRWRILFGATSFSARIPACMSGRIADTTFCWYACACIGNGS